MSCMLMTAAMMIDRTITVIGDPQTTAAGNSMTMMVGKSHHLSILRIMRTISTNLQMPMSILVIQTTFKTTMCALHMKMDFQTLDTLRNNYFGTTDMNDMSVPLQFPF